MLNWIWLGLIVIAIVVAGGRDITELTGERFRNNHALPFELADSEFVETSSGKYTASFYVSKENYIQLYGLEEATTFTGDTIFGTVEYAGDRKFQGPATITFVSAPPTLWKDMVDHHGGEKLSGTLTSDVNNSLSNQPASEYAVRFIPEPIRFRFMAKITDSLVKSVETAVTLALGLIGIMALWLGIMKIAEAAGFVTVLARLARPLMVRLFPEVPADHPAMGAMLSNMAANFLGLSNAATPLGLKAMEELNKLNPVSGTATNAMCMFLTINTSAITLIPATVIAVRASLGSQDPTDIIVPTLLATMVALTCGVFFNRFIQRFFPVKPAEVKGEAA